MGFTSGDNRLGDGFLWGLFHSAHPVLSPFRSAHHPIISILLQWLVSSETGDNFYLNISSILRSISSLIALFLAFLAF